MTNLVSYQGTQIAKEKQKKKNKTWTNNETDDKQIYFGKKKKTFEYNDSIRDKSKELRKQTVQLEKCIDKGK